MMLFRNSDLIMKKLFILLSIIYQLAYVLGQLPENPCPDNFIYEESERYGTVGRVTFTSIPPGDHEVRVRFSQKPPTPTYLKNYTISFYHNERSLERRLRNGDPVSFRVLFPMPDALPKVIYIALDDEVFCRSSRYPQPSSTFQVYSRITNPNFNRTEVNTQRAFVHFPELQPNGTVKKLFEQTTTKSFLEFSELEQPTANCGREGNIEEEEVPRLVPFILGGDDIEPGRFPWLAAIMHENPSGGWVFRCGGTLITSRLVLTAAHCLVNSNRELANVRVELGRHNINLAHENNQVYIPTAKSLLNPDYLKHTFPDADVGLVVLSQDVQFTARVSPICLWTGPADSNRVAGNTGVVVGWGIDESGQGSNEPKMISVPIVSELECRKNHPVFFNLLTDRTLCAGKLDGTGPLKGDSGSALMMKRGERWVLRGLVSVGLSRSGNERHTFVIYCDVAKFTAWIRQEINNIE